MIRISVTLFGLMTLLLGVIYPLFMTGVGYLVLPMESDGSLIKINGVVVGSECIGQSFTSDHYFNSRPSAANYDAAHSSGSNLGPTSQKLADQIASRLAAYRAQNNLGATDVVPADAVNASASGLDPHISFANALLQAPRIANARNLAIDDVIAMIEKHTQGATLGIFGEKRVHVLNLNLQLDGSSLH